MGEEGMANKTIIGLIEFFWSLPNTDDNIHQKDD